MNRALAVAALTAAFALPALPRASAQCDDDSIVCADASFSASISFGRRRHHQVIVAQPAPPPPVVVVQQAPRPRGRIVVVQPAPPAPPPQPVVIQRQQPAYHETVVVVEHQPQRYRLVRPWQNRKVGLTARMASMISSDVRMGGIQAGLRFRPSRIFGLEIGVGAFGGTDYNEMRRLEVPVSFDMLFFLPRESRLQMYFLTGMHVAYTATEGYHSGYGRDMSRQMGHFGAQVGVGLEWRLSPAFALSADIRAFIRERLGDGAPEFVNPVTGQTSDTSVGAVGSLGMHFYF